MEKLMQYVWQSGLWGRGSMVSVRGLRVDIIDRGVHNRVSGPDFFNAKVVIDGQLWAGNVEIHVKASDWHRHRHDGDKAYGNVVLHVVACDDDRICVCGRELEQVVMEDAERYAAAFERVTSGDADSVVRCAGGLRMLSSLEIAEWLGAVGFERLQRKSGDIRELASTFRGDWGEAVYVTLARGLGFGVNSQCMEMLARSMPLKYLCKHGDSLLSVEAMLLGQGDLLCGDSGNVAADAYNERLVAEYAFMRTKFNLTPLNNPGWKYGGVRPENSPSRRVAMLAALIHNGIATDGALMDVGSVEQARALFDVDVSDYWHTHIRAGGEASGRAGCRLSQQSRDILIINVIVPLMYARGEVSCNRRLMQRAADILEQMKAERNSKVDAFVRAGLKVDDAMSSQAAIELYNEYCSRRRCLSCRFAHRLLARDMRTEAR